MQQQAIGFKLNSNKKVIRGGIGYRQKKAEREKQNDPKAEIKFEIKDFQIGESSLRNL